MNLKLPAEDYMDEKLLTHILKKYGLRVPILVILIGIILGSAAWFFAHQSSATGTQVKVLWGFVEYTKGPIVQKPSTIAVEEEPSTIAVEEEPSTTAVEEEPSTDSNDTPPKINLQISYGLTADDYKQKIESVRSLHKLRELTPLESDRPLQDNPPGTYFFVFSLYLSLPSYGDSGYRNLLDAKSSRQKELEWAYFEVHHRDAGQFVFLGFLSETDGNRIHTLDGQQDHNVTIAATLWDPFSALVELPLNRIIKSDDRTLDFEERKKLDVLDLTIR